MAYKRWFPHAMTLLLAALLVLTQQIWASPIVARLTATTTGSSKTTINYQGYLTDSSGNPVNDPLDMVFRLYNVESGSEALWTEEQNGVVVSDGLFSVLLGNVTPISTEIIANNNDLWLGIAVGGDEEMIPREKIASAPYALLANVPDGSITSAKLADDAVTSSKIAQQFGASDKPLLNFVIREDLSGSDWTYCWPLGWSDWDLSSIVGDTAVMVQLHVSIDGARGIQAAFRKNGESGVVQEKRVISQNNDPYGFQIDVVVETDSNQVIERAVVAGEGGGCVSAVVVGWWEPAHAP
jgi:hypothetical protein